jgi:hypothetical protein
MLPPTTDYLRSVGQLIAHPNPATWAGLFATTRNAPLGGGVATLMRFVSFALYPLSYAAVTAAIGALCTGRGITPGNAYQLALKRWLQFLIVTIIFYVISFAILAIMGIVIAIGSSIIGASLFVVQAKVAGAIASMVFALVVIVLGIPPLAWVILANYFSYVEIIVAGPNPFSAIGKSFGRVFARGFRVRSLMESLAVGAVFVGSWIIGLFVSVLLFNLGQKSFVIDVVTTVLSLITTLIIFGFVTVAYFDTTARLAVIEPAPVPVTV